MIDIAACSAAGFAAALAAAANAASAPDSLQDARPNFVLVMADDQGFGDVGYNGHPHLATPNLDLAAASGLRFDRFYAAAPVCSPTRASVLTGRHPNRMATFSWGHPIRPQEITLAEALREVGYATGHFGKWHLGSVRRQSPVHPGRNGFDEWWSAPNFFDNDPILSHRGEAVALRGESSMVTAELALDWIEERSKDDRPFLAVVWFGSPHDPHRASDLDREPYAGLPERVQHFLGEITGLDRAFGRLRDGLASLGIRERTLLWYTSDNGALPGLGSTGGRRGAKNSLYEGGVLVPAFIEWPSAIQGPRSTDLPCSTSDIFPTLLDLAGAFEAAPEVLDGVSLRPILEGADTMKHPPIGFWKFPARGIASPSEVWMRELLEAQSEGRDLPPYDACLSAATLPLPRYPPDTWRGHSAWLEGRWKLHRRENGNGEVRFELYDLADDPREERDLSAHEPERVRAMATALEGWLASVVRSLNGDDYES